MNTAFLRQCKYNLKMLRILVKRYDSLDAYFSCKNIEIRVYPDYKYIPRITLEKCFHHNDRLYPKNINTQVEPVIHMINKPRTSTLLKYFKT